MRPAAGQIVAPDAASLAEEANVVPRIGFMCVYCGRPHPSDWHAREHVIPGALGNDELVLGGTCKGWNSFFARTFENRVMASDMFRDLRARHVPGAPPIERRIADRGTVRVVDRDGFHERRIVSERRSTRVTIQFVNAMTGEVTAATATLSEEVVVGSYGPPEDVRKKFDRTKGASLAAVRRHVAAVLERPELDPDLAAVFRAHDVGLAEIRSVGLKEGPTDPGGTPTVRDEYNVDMESLVRFVAKCCWTYGRLALGPRFENDRFARRILGALQDYAFPGTAFGGANPAPDLLRVVAADVPVGPVLTWSRPVQATEELLARLPEGKLTDALQRAHSRRVRHRHGLGRLVQIQYDGSAEVGSTDRRSHGLNLVTGWTTAGPSRPITIGELDLFGGLFRCEVVLCEGSAPEVRRRTISLAA